MNKFAKIAIGLAILYTVPKIAFSIVENSQMKQIRETYASVAADAQKTLPLVMDDQVTLTSVIFDGSTLTKNFTVSDESLLDVSEKEHYKMAALSQTCDSNQTIKKGDITVHYVYALETDLSNSIDIVVLPSDC